MSARQQASPPDVTSPAVGCVIPCGWLLGIGEGDYLWAAQAAMDSHSVAAALAFDMLLSSARGTSDTEILKFFLFWG